MYVAFSRLRPILAAASLAAISAGLVLCWALPAAAQLPGVPLFSSSSKAPSGPPPKVELPDPIYNFGTVLNGKPVKHVFTIKNGGKGPLIIGDVMTSCGCTAAKPTKTRLAPGEETQIAVTLDTRAERGKVTRTITAFTNDPKHLKAVMTLKGNVKILVDATPEEVAFGNVQHGTAANRRILITDLSEKKDFKIGPISNSSSYIKVREVARHDGKRGAALDVALLKTAPIGGFTDTVRVTTNRGSLEVPVFGMVTGNLTVKPAQVSFGIVPHRQGVIRIVRLTNRGKGAVRVLGVSSTNQSVTAEVQPVNPGKEYKITLVLRKNTPDGQLRGHLAIHTDDPQQATLTVPYYAIVGSFQG